MGANKKKFNKKKPTKKYLNFIYILIAAILIVVCTNIHLATTFPFHAYASGKTYYISPSGSDSNSGTSTSSPWKTINKVNSVTYYPGDAILFQGGQTFSGNLYFTSQDAGTSTSPISIGSYGTGNATINAGNSNGIYVYDAAGYYIHNINFNGSGSGTNTGSGVIFYNDLTNNTLLNYINIYQISINGFQQGISIGGGNGSSGYNNVSISYGTVTNCAEDGITTYAQQPNVNQNIYVGNLTVSNITGVSSQSTNSGNGIVLGSVNFATIEKSIVHDSGQLCTASQCAAGIWTYNSTGVYIQHNEVYNMHTGSQSDGDGVDLDINTSNSFLQFNYTHNNDGPGILLASNTQGSNSYNNNTVRYNISENDARKNTSAGAIEAWGSVTNSQIYNNTIYITPNKYGVPNALVIGNWNITNQSANGLYIRNNIFQTTGGVPFINVISSEFPAIQNIVLQGNDYFPSGSSSNFIWGDNSYGSLASWQAATVQEKLNGINVGSIVNPKLISPGNGGIISNINNLANLTAYKLQSSSPMINSGLNLSTQFSINPGNVDFYGTSIPQGSAFDIGAYEYP